MTYQTSTYNLQKNLKSKGFYKGALDDIYGDKTASAINGFLHSRKSKLTFEIPYAGLDRKITACWQLICLEAGIPEVGAIDGWRGPNTERALIVLESLEKTGERPTERDRLEDEPVPEQEPVPVKNLWPFQKDVERFYGRIGQNQAMLQVPYTHKLAWQPKTKIQRFSIHEKCHDSALRVLKRTLDHYGPKRIVDLKLDMFGGCLNPRPMTGGTRPSMHSWGIALDYDPANNQYKWGRNMATFAKPDYDMWWKFWEEEGWVSLGRVRNFDWMHVQAARIA